MSALGEWVQYGGQSLVYFDRPPFPRVGDVIRVRREGAEPAEMMVSRVRHDIVPAGLLAEVVVIGDAAPCVPNPEPKEETR